MFLKNDQEALSSAKDTTRIKLLRKFGKIKAKATPKVYATVLVPYLYTKLKRKNTLHRQITERRYKTKYTVLDEFS